MVRIEWLKGMELECIYISQSFVLMVLFFLLFWCFHFAPIRYPLASVVMNDVLHLHNNQNYFPLEAESFLPEESIVTLYSSF